MGATPMIGQNDVPGETFTLSDAQRARLLRPSRAPRPRLDVVGQPRLAVRRPVARRPGLEHVQRHLAEAARVHLGARPAERPPAGAHDRPGAAGRVAHADPRRSGDQPVSDLARHQDVPRRRARSSGTTASTRPSGTRRARVPDAPVKHLWDTPWRYLGPILSTDVTTGASSSTLDPWNADQVYLEGSTVLYNGLVYKAKWWTQADTPSSDPQRLGNVPWQARRHGDGCTAAGVGEPRQRRHRHGQRRVARATPRSGARPSSSRRRRSGARSRARPAKSASPGMYTRLTLSAAARCSAHAVVGRDAGQIDRVDVAMAREPRPELGGEAGQHVRDAAGQIRGREHLGERDRRQRAGLARSRRPRCCRCRAPVRAR